MSSATETVAIVINPIAGTGGRPDAARRRAGLAAAVCERRQVPAGIFVTERGGHARELAAAAVARGVSTIIAWGGDGTVNEVASALVSTGAALGIVPTGSGNGLARELGVPFDAGQAIDMALAAPTRFIDAAALDGRLFFNIAGIGFDARVAHQFSETGLARRGLRRYAEIAIRELFASTPGEYTVVADAGPITARAMFIAIANGRQYGHGALIAPIARLDDGQLDITIVDHRSPFAAMRHLPRLFRGRVASVPGVTTMRTAELTVSAAEPLVCHVDGEAFTAGTAVKARVFPGILRVRAPALSGARSR